MKAPSFLAPFLDGDSPKRLIQGLAVGAIGTMVIGFNWGGWNIGSTVEQKVETAGVSAMVAALAPICADKFEQAAKADNDLIIKLSAVNSWERDNHLMKTGWTTFPGTGEPDYAVAQVCSELLNTALKLR